MKKVFIATLSLIFLSLQANAARKSRFFVGTDYLSVDAKHEYFVNYQATILNPARIDASNVNHGIGFSLGYRAYLKQLFVAPEFFFDYINSSTADFYASEAGFDQDELAINYRYGLKINVGYNLWRTMNVFVNAGISRVDFDIRWKNEGANQAGNRSYGSSKIVPIYGAGISYDITPYLTLRLGWDMQNFNLRYVEQGLVDRVTLNVYKAGFTVNF